MNKLTISFILLLVVHANASPTPPLEDSIFAVKDILVNNLKDKEGRGVVESVLYIIEDGVALRPITSYLLSTTKIINPHPFAIPGDPYREDLHGKIECSCVRYARSLGLSIPYNTNAIDLKPNTKISIGVGVLFSEAQGHIAVVTEIEKDGFWIDEGDYKKCERTKRFIKFNDPYNKLIGFYDPQI